jgi:hypothetical protein
MLRASCLVALINDAGGKAKGELLVRKVASLIIAKRRQRAHDSNLRDKSKKAGSQKNF